MKEPTEKRTETGIILPPTTGMSLEEQAEAQKALWIPPVEATGAVSRRSWRRGKVREPPEGQEALEARTKAKRRKTQKAAKKARRKNR